MADNNIPIVNLKDFYNKTIKEHAPYLTHQFQVRIIKDDDGWFNNIDNDKTDSNSLSFPFYVQSASIPQLTIGEAQINFLSQDFVVPKVTQHGGQWNVNLILTNDLSPYSRLYMWQQSYADLAYSGGSWPGEKKAIPEHKAVVDLLDSTHQHSIATFVLHGVYPTGLPTIDFRYENAATTKNLAFAFVWQYMTDTLGNETKANGLVKTDRTYYTSTNWDRSVDNIKDPLANA